MSNRPGIGVVDTFSIKSIPPELIDGLKLDYEQTADFIHQGVRAIGELLCCATSSGEMTPDCELMHDIGALLSTITDIGQACRNKLVEIDSSPTLLSVVNQ